MKISIKQTIVISFLLILFFIIFYNFYQLYYENKKLLTENKILVERKNELEKELVSLNNTLLDLKNRYNILSNNYENLKKDYETLYKNYLELNKSFASLRNQLEVYTKDKIKVQEYLLNNFNYDFSKEAFILDIRNYCISEKTLNYPCMIEILKNRYGFSYKELEWFKDEVNISDFVRLKYGDCKSWSFFSIAIIKYFYRKGEINKLKVYYSYPGERFILYYEGNVYYYYPNSKEYIISLDKFSNLYVFCYQNLTRSSGHCISGISDILINPDNYNYTNLIIFEPQTGEYLGNMKDFLLKNRDIIINYIFSDDGFFYHRPLYLVQWGDELWIWI